MNNAWSAKIQPVFSTVNRNKYLKNANDYLNYDDNNMKASIVDVVRATVDQGNDDDGTLRKQGELFGGKRRRKGAAVVLFTGR